MTGTSSSSFKAPKELDIRTGPCCQLLVGRAISRHEQAMGEVAEGVDRDPEPLVRLDQAATDQEIVAVIAMAVGAEQLGVDRRIDQLGVASVEALDLIGDIPRPGDIGRHLAGRAAVRRAHPRRQGAKGRAPQGSGGPAVLVGLGHRPGEAKRAVAVADLRSRVGCSKPMCEGIARGDQDFGGWQPDGP